MTAFWAAYAVGAFGMSATLIAFLALENHDIRAWGDPVPYPLTNPGVWAVFIGLGAAWPITVFVLIAVIARSGRS